MRSSLVVRALVATVLGSSQHPSTHWNLTAANEAVLNIVRKKIKPPPPTKKYCCLYLVKAQGPLNRICGVSMDAPFHSGSNDTISGRVRLRRPEISPFCTLQRSSILALQRQNAENRDLSPNFHMHVSVSELYISMMGLPVLLEEICGPILGIYKSLTDT